MKKSLSLLLALIMVLALAPAVVLAEEPVTLRVEAFDRTVPGFNVEDCMQLDYIQENFGDPNNIKVEFVSVPRWSETEVLNTLLAGGTAPDICFTYDGGLIQQYIDMGGLLPLNDLLAEYGQNLSALLGEGVLQYGEKEGVQHFIPARRMSTDKLGAFIRADWLEALEMEVPTTIDEWVDFLYAAKEADLGETATVPYTMNLYENAPLFSSDLIIQNFLKLEEIDPADWFSLYTEMMPGAQDGYRLLNQLYNDGLISENFAIDTSGDIKKSDMYQGNSGFYIEGSYQVWTTNDNYQQELTKNTENGKWIPVNCFQNEQGFTIHPAYAANGFGIFIPSWVSEDVAKAAIMYLDWMADPENLFFLQNGVEGINFLSKTEEGVAYDAQPNDVVPDENKMHGGDIPIIVNGKYYDTEEKVRISMSLSYPGYEDLFMESLGYALTDNYEPTSFSVSLQSEADYSQLVLAKQGEFLANVLTCKPEEFDDVYERSIQAILDVGGEAIIAERLAAYEAGNYRGDFPLDVLGK